MVAGLLLLAVLAGCSSSGGDATNEATTTTEAPCPGGKTVPTSGLETISDATGEREYFLHVPDGYDGTTPAPLLLNIHGLTSNIEEQDIVSDLPEMAGARGYVVVTPQAIDQEGTTRWNVGLDAAPTENDVAYLQRLVDSVEQQLCIDPAREFVAGVSNGAMMTMALRCAAGDRFAAFAPVAGVNIGPTCTSPVEVPLIAFHGDADPLVAYKKDGEAGGVPATMADLAAQGGCETPPTSDQPFDDAVHDVWTCPPGMALELWTIIGGGHTWPGVTTYVDPNTARKNPDGTAAGSPYGLPGLVLHQTEDVVATTLMLDFFDDHPRPPG